MSSTADRIDSLTAKAEALLAVLPAHHRIIVGPLVRELLTILRQLEESRRA